MRQSNSLGCLIAALILGLGFLVAGPFGLIFLPLAFILMGSGRRPRVRMGGTGQNPFTTNQGRPTHIPLLVLFAAVMRADGRIMRSELDIVKGILLQQFGPIRTQALLIDLRDLLREQLPLSESCIQIRIAYSQPQREQIMRFLFQIALADGSMATSERQLLRQIAQAIGVQDRDYSQLYDSFRSADVDHYQTLGLTREASSEEVRKAYRKLAQQWHPDKYATQSETTQRQAAEKFKEINTAYEAIRQQRGMR